MTTEADRLEAAGVPITLTDGREVWLRYSMRSLKSFEDNFGSVTAAVESLNGLFPRNGKPPANEKAVSTLLPLLAAGLLHEGLDEEALYDLTSFFDKDAYLVAISAALDQAFPLPASPGKASKARSRGGASTTQPRRASAGATSSSGT